MKNNFTQFYYYIRFNTTPINNNFMPPPLKTIAHGFLLSIVRNKLDHPYFKSWMWVFAFHNGLMPFFNNRVQKETMNIFKTFFFVVV